MSDPRTDAVARVTRLGATGSRPALEAGDVAAIVDAHLLPDANGVRPGVIAWSPTYDTNAAIAEVWAQKAAQVAADFNFSADDGDFSKGDVLAHMLAMEAKYAALAVSLDPRTGALPGPANGTLTVAGTNSGSFVTLDQIAARVIP